jgi:hypothetical protein
MPLRYNDDSVEMNINMNITIDSNFNANMSIEKGTDTDTDMDKDRDICRYKVIVMSSGACGQSLVQSQITLARVLVTVIDTACNRLL